jgi:hypothetical protein
LEVYKKDKLKKINMFKTKKGVANLMSYFLYLFISLVVLSTIVYMAQETISKNEERYQFEELIKNIELISNTFDNVLNSRFSAREVTIYNPDVLEIDCENNLIRGEVRYTQNLKDFFEINDIEIERVNNRVYASKIINNTNINIECNPVVFNKGKQKYIFKYQEYDPIEEKIILFIDSLDFYKSYLKSFNILSPINNSVYSIGEEINFKLEVVNSDGNYSCKWTSDVDGELNDDNALIVHYDFSQNDGNLLTDISGNNKTGTIFGDTPFFSIDTPTNQGNSLKLNGINNYVEISNLTANNKVISLYFKANSSSLQVITAGILGNTYYGLVFVNRKLSIAGSGGSSEKVITVNQYDLDRWYHVILVNTGEAFPNQFEIYVDGVLQNVVVGGEHRASGGNFLGSRYYGGEQSLFFDGYLYDVKVYNQDVSLEKIKNLYSSPNNCDFNISTLSPGEHTITLEIIDQSEIKIKEFDIIIN